MLANLIATIATGSTAAATTFGQRILPMDCVFETINDGTGTLHYLTPAACGVVVTPSPSEPDIPILSPQPNLNFSTGTASPTTPIPAHSNTSTVQLPWQQVVTQDAGKAHPAFSSPSHVSGVVIASTAVGIVAVIALVIFLL